MRVKEAFIIIHFLKFLSCIDVITDNYFEFNKADMENLGKVLFNLQRFQILQTKVNPQTTSYIPNDYAYAWYVELFPLLNEGGFHEDLESYFTITKEQVDVITGYADSEWLKKQYYNFYQYESYFKNSSKIDRSVLIRVFRYMYLREAFDDQFWSKLLEPMNYPSEAQSIIRRFDIDSIYFI